ncbi:hypothetical protein ACIBQ1_48495 [Nonomuraea sp. NPDC050153]
MKKGIDYDIGFLSGDTYTERMAAVHLRRILLPARLLGCPP